MSARISDFIFGETIPATSWLDSFLELSRIRISSELEGTTSWTTEPGGIHRLFVVTHIPAPDSGEDEYLINNEIDWRDRIMIVAYCHEEYTGSVIFPGVEDPASNENFDDNQGVTIGYFNYSGSMTNLELCTGIEIKADNTTGDLMLVIDSNASNFNSLIIMVMAMEQTGERSTPDTMPAIPYNSDGEYIEPIDLNALQDAAILSQTKEIDVDNPLSGRVFPLGFEVHGTPPIPVVWSNQLRNGLMTNTGNKIVRATKPTRQKTAGSIKIHGGFALTTSNILLDDQNDWRDRCIMTIGRYDFNNNILPGETNDTDHNDADSINSFGYLGSGGDGQVYYHRVVLVSGLSLYADPDDGSLYARVESPLSIPIYTTMMIYGTFKLGTRS